MKLSVLAQKLNLNFSGTDRDFFGLNTLENAKETEISFFSNPKYLHFLKKTHACAVIVSKEFAHQVENALVSTNPYLDFSRAASFFLKKQGEYNEVSPLATIDPSSTIEQGCIIYPHAFIGPRVHIGASTEIFPGAYIGEDCVIGSDCKIMPNAVIMAGVTLGKGCTVKSGAVIGSDGFGFIRTNGQVVKIPQIGSVSLADNIDIGANSCVDKSTLGATSVGHSTKVDNLVQIGHNVQIGEQTFLVSQVGIAGSTQIGDRVTIAGQAGLSGHLTIGDDVTIGPKSGVPKNIPSKTIGCGNPFMPHETYLRHTVLTPRIPDMYNRLKALEKELSELKKQLINQNKENS